ncbi:MAG: nucleoside 2-deoxyribosyltransferase [Deltaproteobacteria bacterium]|nr:nucleoside 2-deoxyribosyltransferase [Deltaproteobacteria bacterium]
MEKNRIYCSGPLFCAEEVGGMSAIAKVLEDSGFQTFLPHRDGLEAYIMRFGNSSFPSTISGIRTRADYAIFSLDAYELIERCNAVVCNLNGRVPDEGMIVEAALAYAAGKPLVLFKDDARAPFGGYDNSMLTSLARGKIVRKLKELPSALKNEMSQKTDAAPLSGDLKKAISYGKRISSAIERLPENIGKKQWSEEVISQVIDEALKSE